MKVLFDTHTHSKISDGWNTPEEMLEAAATQGLEIFALTDHFDIHEHFPKELSPFDGAGREDSYETLSALKKRWDSDNHPLKFLKGIEIGQAHHFKETAENWLNNHDYDFVIGSCHIIRNHMDFYHVGQIIKRGGFENPDRFGRIVTEKYSDWLEKNQSENLLKQYFEELIELCEWCSTGSKKFDTLAHLTYPLRYMECDNSLIRHKAAIDELFRVMTKNEIALEINTQSVTGGAIVCPDLPLVKRFREMGGRLITIGSDSHSVDTIAGGIDVGIAIAQAAGFNECVYFENRKVCIIKL